MDKKPLFLLYLFSLFFVIHDILIRRGEFKKKHASESKLTFRSDEYLKSITNMAARGIPTSRVRNFVKVLSFCCHILYGF